MSHRIHHIKQSEPCVTLSACWALVADIDSDE